MDVRAALHGLAERVANEMKLVAYLAKANNFTAINQFSAGEIDLTNATANIIDLGAAGQSPVGNGVNPPLGQKITLFKTRAAADGDYAIGVDANTLWYSMGSGASRQHKFYVANTLRFTVSNSGASVGGALSVSGTSTLAGLSITASAAVGTTITVAGGSKLGGYASPITGSTTIVGTSGKYFEVGTSGVTVTLPSASGAGGFDYYIFNTSAGAITVTAASGQTIGNGASPPQSVSVTAGTVLHVVSNNNTAWRTL